MGIAHNLKNMVGLGTPIVSRLDLFMHGLKDIYYGEKALVDALGTMRDEATEPQLKDAFQNHLHETEIQAKRLEDVFHILGHEPEKVDCKAIDGLVAEAEDIIADADATTVDDGLIFAAEGVEHYEIARYTSLIRMAYQLGYGQVAKLLQQNLHEEKAALETLADITGVKMPEAPTKTRTSAKRSMAS